MYFCLELYLFVSLDSPTQSLVKHIWEMCTPAQFGTWKDLNPQEIKNENLGTGIVA